MTQKSVTRTLNLAAQVTRELLPIMPPGLLAWDITTVQLRIMLTLFLNGPTRMSALAGILNVSLPTTTGIIDRLAERDIVAREDDPNDRRVVICRLSNTGKEMLSQTWQSARERTRELLTAVPPDKLPIIDEALNLLLAAGTATRSRIDSEMK